MKPILDYKICLSHRTFGHSLQERRKDLSLQSHHSCLAYRGLETDLLSDGLSQKVRSTFKGHESRFFNTIPFVLATLVPILSKSWWPMSRCLDTTWFQPFSIVYTTISPLPTWSTLTPHPTLCFCRSGCCSQGSSIR